MDPLNNGYVTTQFYALAIEPGDATSEVVIGGLQDNGTWFTKTTEFDTLWKYIGSGDGMYCAMTNGLDYYVTCKQRGKMYLKQIDPDGNVLAHERIDPEGGPSTYNWANSLKMDPNNNYRLFWNGRDRLWRLDDMSQIALTMNRQDKEPNFWNELDSSEIAPQAGIITDIEMCVSDSGKVWYGTTNGYVYRLDDAYAQLPSHPQLVDISSDDFPYNAYVSCVAVNPFDSDQIVVTFANYNVKSIWLTTDGGQTWDDISGNLEENADGSGAGPAVFWAEYYIDGTIFVGTSTGLYTTGLPDGTNTVWTLEPGVGNVPVNHMDYRTHDGYFAVATHGRGIFSTHLQPGFAGKTTIQPTPITIYPNPTADLVFVQTKEPALDLTIYSLSGQMMYSNKANQTTEIDVSNYSAGTYIIVLETSEGKHTRKFVKR